MFEVANCDLKAANSRGMNRNRSRKRPDGTYIVRAGGSANPIFLRRLGGGFISLRMALTISWIVPS